MRLCFSDSQGWGVAVTPRFQIGANWLHLHCVMALRRRQGGSMRRRSLVARQFSEASLRAPPALTTALAVLIPSARYENRPILCPPKPHRFVEQRPSWSPMKESPARARAVSILKHRLNHRSAVSPPAVIRVGGYIEDANPITGQNAETGADRDSLFFSQPSRHPRSAQNGGRAKRREQYHRASKTGGHCGLISSAVFHCGATNLQ